MSDCFKVLTSSELRIHKKDFVKPGILPFKFTGRMSKLITHILFPVLPVIGSLFTLFYFSIGFYMYNNPYIEEATICD